MSSSFKLSDLEEVTSNAENIQNDLLKEILTLNANTEYLWQFLHGSSDKSFFKKHVPVVSYEDVKPYIERVADGEPSEVISGGPITKFLRSSGTSGGKQKIFPVNDDYAKKLGYVLALRSLLMSNHKSWEGIITRLWPKSRSLEAIFTGQMAQYIPILEFYANKLPQVSTIYGCSESTFGMNMDPLSKPQDVSYTFLPNISYFEFLPIDHERGDIASIVDLVNVKLGCYYEPVVTSSFGLTRYLIGDILQVVGFYNSTPQFRFVRRKNMVLSVGTEMTTEEDILKALSRASLVLESSSDVMLIGFTCYADISTFPGHYVFYWELKAKGVLDVVEPDKKVLVECCSVLEESFDALYRRLRNNDGLIGALEIRVVQQGTFHSLMEYFTSQGGSTAQYKTPICMNSSEALAVLESKVLARFYSERSPPLDSLKRDDLGVAMSIRFRRTLVSSILAGEIVEVVESRRSRRISPETSITCRTKQNRDEDDDRFDLINQD
ncbi:hypothetical protein Bca4012_064224 [Brassica carinata]